MGGVYMHELTHQTIYEYHGINSTIKLFNFDSEEHFWDALTIVDANQPACSENCRLAQDIVEAIGYQLMYIWMIIFAGLAIIISLISFYYDIESLKEERQKEETEGNTVVET
jgi:hypothetical protein